MFSLILETLRRNSADLVGRATHARLAAIEVDSMTLEELRGRAAPAASPPTPTAAPWAR